MRVFYRMTMLLGLLTACLASFPSLAAAQDDGDRGRREDRSDDDDNDGPRGPRGGGEFGPPGGGPGGDFGGRGGFGGPFGGPGGGFGGPGGGGPGGGWSGPGGGGPGRGGPGGGWGGPGGGGGWGGPGGGWGGRGGDGEGRRGRGGGGFGGGGFGGFNPVDMFARQDRNGDGQIALDELDERSRGFMQRMAQNNGLSESGPWRIEELRQRIEDRFGGGRGRDGENDRGPDGGNRGNSDGKEAKKPLVPGFGALASLSDEPVILVPGFGIPEKEASSSESSSQRGSRSPERSRASTSSSRSPATSRGGGGGSSSRSGGGSRNEERARTMVKSNDANNDGKLQPDEMSEMIAKPKDANGDGAVTVEEIAAELDAIDRKKAGGSEQSADRAGPGERARGERGPRGGSSSSDDGERKSFRFLTPKERLPKGIPDWFVDADDDGDGQVLLAEYSDRLTESKAREFARRDLDGDGVITPREAASGEKSRDE